MGRHTDQAASDLNHSETSVESEFQTYNASVTDDDRHISHPPESRQQIELRKPDYCRMAKRNKLSRNEMPKEMSVDKLFDTSLCDVAAYVLDVVDIEMSQIGLPKLRALMLQEARDLDHYADLAEYIAAYGVHDAAELGLPTATSKSTYRKAAKELKKADDHNELLTATYIAVYILFRNGIPLPEVVKEKYDARITEGPIATEFPRSARQLGLYRLVDDLLDITVEELTIYERDRDPETLKSILGMLAFAAFSSQSYEYYQQTAQHLYDLDPHIQGGSLRRQLDKLDLWKVREMFNTIYRQLLKYVLRSGVVSEPVTVSYDLTDVDGLGISDDGARYRTADGRWRFASLALTDPDVEFGFGLQLLTTEKQRAPVLERFLRNLTSVVDVELFMTDRAFDGRDDLEACQKFIPGRWLICAQDTSDDVRRDHGYSELRAHIEPGGTVVIEDAGFQNLKQPVKLLGYSGASEDDSDPDPVRGFWSDMSLPDDEEERENLITDLNFLYNKRAKIERMFGSSKNAFDVEADTDKQVRKAFHMHMSILFFNIYKIVNTVPDPIYGLEFDTTQQEVLTVIANLGFGGPEAPAAIERVLNE